MAVKLGDFLFVPGFGGEMQVARESFILVPRHVTPNARVFCLPILMVSPRCPK